jgi:hypothetical protein
MARRLHRHDLFLTKDFSGTDARQIAAASAVAKAYKQGATANGSGSIATTASGNITVRHPGLIVVGDTVVVGTGSATAIVNTVAATMINVTAGGSTFAWADGDRIVVTSARPSTYIESTGNVATSVASQATTDSVGHAFFYAEEEAVDILYSSDSFVTVSTLYDVDGVGGNVYLSNELDGASAVGFLFKLKRALTTSGAKIFQILNSAGSELFSVDKDGAPSLAAGQVGTTQLAADAVDNTKLADNAVQTENIAAGAVGTSDIATGGVATGNLATAAAVTAPAQGVNSVDQTLTSTTYLLVTGATVTITPDSSGSVLHVEADMIVAYSTGTANRVWFEIFNTSNSTSYAEGTVVLTASTDNDQPVHLKARITGLTGSNVFQLRAKIPTGLTAVIIKGTSPSLARMTVTEFKKAV